MIHDPPGYPDGNKYAEAIRQDDARTHELSDPVKSHTEAEIVLFYLLTAVCGGRPGRTGSVCLKTLTGNRE